MQDAEMCEMKIMIKVNWPARDSHVDTSVTKRVATLHVFNCQYSLGVIPTLYMYMLYEYMDIIYTTSVYERRPCKVLFVINTKRK